MFNIINPPKECNLLPASGMGREDESGIIQALIDYAVANNYGTILFPKPLVSYRCDHGIVVPMDMISVQGENSLFDFSYNTERYCFRLKCTSPYTERITHKHTFTGVSVNNFESNNRQTIPTTGIYIDGSDCEKDCFAHDNFRISRCSVVHCYKGIEFGAHAWRLRIEDSLFMWNTYHVYQYDTPDTGEDIHFEGCMFCDGGCMDVAVPIEINFCNCSIDNIEMHFRYGCNAYFNQCHIEYGKGGHIKQPIITLENDNVNVTFDQTVMVVNSNVFEVSPVAVQDGSKFSGVIFEKCMLPLDKKYFNTPEFVKSGLPVQFVSGLGKVKASANYGFGRENCVAPFSQSLNEFANCDFEDDDLYIPIYKEAASGGEMEIVDTEAYHGEKSLRISCDAMQSFRGYIEVDAKPLQNIAVSIPCKIISEQGKMCAGIEFVREDGAIIKSGTYSGVESYEETDQKGEWNVLMMGNICPQGTIKARVFVSVLSNDCENLSGDQIIGYLDALTINVY